MPTKSRKPNVGAIVPKLLTLQETADLTNISKTSIRRLASAGVFRVFRTKGRYGLIRLYQESVLAWIEANTYGGQR